MSRVRYEDDSKLIEAVRDCVLRRLTYKESVDELNARGFEIDLKKFQRVKFRIREIEEEKYSKISDSLEKNSIIQRFDVYQNSITHLEGIINDKKDDRVRIKAIELLLDIKKEQDEFLRSSRILHKMTIESKAGNSD